MRFFKNQDGTFNPVRVFVVVTIVTFALLFLLCKNIIFERRINKVGNIITTTTTTTWNLCQDCSMSLKDEAITMEANTTEKIKNILEVKNITLSSIRFTTSDKDIAQVKTVDGEVTIVAGDQVGTATITGTYDEKKIELEVNVKASKVTKAVFANKVYYAYVGKKTVLELDTSPKNAPLSLMTLKSEDETIGEFDEENNFVGKEIGEVKVDLTVDGKTDTALVHVIKNRMIIKVKTDGAYKEMQEYKYPSNIDSFVELCIKIEDNDHVGYNQSSITNSVISTGKMETTISAEGEYTLDTNAYIFKAHVKLDQTDESTESYSLITFSLPDGSKAQIKITKE